MLTADQAERDGPVPCAAALASASRPGTVTADIAILGGGCAGLSLASRLAVPGGPRCIVLEARPALSNDRTWCSWDDGSLAGWGLRADATWDRWSVRHRGAWAEHVSRTQPYTCIRAESFNRTQLARVAAAGDVSVVMGYAATAVENGDTVVPADPDLPVVRARHIVDTRPPRPLPGILLQHFVGWETETDRAAFDPTRVTLMDFDVDQSDGLQFLYVLPYSETRALVEATVLSTSVWPQAAYDFVLTRYLQSRFGLTEGDRTILRRETGVLPMGPTQPVANAGTIRIGSAGGALRMSSGYGFHFIQRQADVVAESLLGSGDRPPAVPTRGWLTRWMDRVFLEAVQRRPDQAPIYFRRMLTGAGADVFARFMMDRASLADAATVVASLPKMPFMRSAWRTALA
ncbi:MAG: lycopene cyclase family protein [Thalassobaculaceae bacterium]